jgi:ABC-2 type transport system permease protein
MPIFDQGYQHWSGELSGHGWRWLAISRQGVRAAMKTRWLRQLTFLAWTPALSLAGVLCLWGLLERRSSVVANMWIYLPLIDPRIRADPKHYRVVIWTLAYSYFLAIEIRLAMLMILGFVPSLIGQDLRFNALPLYFSRPLRRIDYFIGKLGVIGGFLGMVVIGPAVVAYILGLLFSLDWTIFRDTLPILFGAIAFGLVVTLSAGMLVLALSSLSRSSRYTALAWLGVLLLSSTIGWFLSSVAEHQRLHVYRRERYARNEGYFDWRDTFADEEYRASKTDWRPMVGYLANLTRMRDELLGTQQAWQVLADIQPPEARSRFMMQLAAPPYPWYWSAEVLAGLFVISAWTLTMPVKSLDRLK